MPAHPLPPRTCPVPPWHGWYLPGSWQLEALDRTFDGQPVYSDMYHVGALLQGCQQRIGIVSAHARAFIAGLLGKQLSAREALAHPWLQ